MLVDDRAEIAAHDDQVDAGVRARPGAIARQRSPRRLLDRERELLRPARLERRRRELREPERPRRADRQRARRRAAACEQQEPGPRAHPRASSRAQDEVESRQEAVLRDAKPHDETPVDERILRVQRNAREVEHRRDRTLPARAHRHVEMAGAVCVRPRQDRLEPVVAPSVRELMAPQPDALVVVRRRSRPPARNRLARREPPGTRSSRRNR